MKQIHSLLFVPANLKTLDKIVSLSSDAFIIDLEDSIREEDKTSALELVVNYFKAHTDGNCYVRIDRSLMVEQLSSLRGTTLCGYMIPKIESADDVIRYAEYLGGKEVIALIETPRGLVNVPEIAACPMVTALAFGAEDYTAICGMENKPEILSYHRSRIVMYAKANGKSVYDTPCFNLDDDALAEAETKQSVYMGFDGKLAIHPKMLPIIARYFGDHNLAYLKSVVEQYESSGAAVLRIGEKVFEKMHINRIKKILKENNYD